MESSRPEPLAPPCDWLPPYRPDGRALHPIWGETETTCRLCFGPETDPHDCPVLRHQYRALIAPTRR